MLQRFKRHFEKFQFHGMLLNPLPWHLGENRVIFCERAFLPIIWYKVSVETSASKFLLRKKMLGFQVKLQQRQRWYKTRASPQLYERKRKAISSAENSLWDLHFLQVLGVSFSKVLNWKAWCGQYIFRWTIKTELRNMLFMRTLAGLGWRSKKSFIHMTGRNIQGALQVPLHSLPTTLSQKQITCTWRGQELCDK